MCRGDLDKSYLKRRHSRFYLETMFLKITQKVAKYLGYFSRTFVAKNFEKSPNLVTLGNEQLNRLHIQSYMKRCICYIKIFDMLQT